MSVDSSQLDVGDQGGGFFSNKRNLLFLAIAIGGGLGLLVFLMRKNQPTVAAEDQPNAMTQTDLQLGNIAQQLLQFRGESSKAAADLQTGVDANATTLAALGSGLGAQSDTLAGFGETLTGLQSGISGLGGQLTGLGGQISGVSGQVSGVQSGVSNLTDYSRYYYGDLTSQIQTVNQNVYQGIAQGNDNFTRLRDIGYLSAYSPYRLPPQPVPKQTGAGGFSPGDWLSINWTDAGNGYGGQWYPLVSGLTPRKV